MDNDLMTKRLSAALGASGMTQAELARASGIDRASISLYLSGRYHPKADKLIRLAAALGTTPEWLSGMEPQHRSEPALPFPILAGLDEQGEPRPTEQSFLIPKAALDGAAPEEFFLLRVEGLAMYPRLLDGDLLLVKKTTDAPDGATVVLVQDGALLIRTLQGGMLLPANPEFPPRMRTPEQRLLGRAVSLYRQL